MLNNVQRATSMLRRIVLFSFHAYGTWMPDRPQGYYRNRDGLREQNEEEAATYRGRQRERSSFFDGQVQSVLLTTLRESAPLQGWTLIAAGTDDVHLHLIAGWSDARSPAELQQRIKWAITRDLNARVRRRTWLTRRGHDRRVRDRAHLRYLRDEYLPSHRGLRWDRRDEVRSGGPTAGRGPAAT